jgi:hypothetical protein
MIILDSATKSVEVLLNGTVTTNQFDFVTSWVDIIGGPPPTSFLSGGNDGTTNNTTAVSIVPAPGALTQRQVKIITVYNADTASAIVTVRYKNGASTRKICVVTLVPGSTLFYTDGEGFRVIDSSGALVTTAATGNYFMGIQILTADPTNPSDDTVWAVRNGYGAGTTVAIRFRIAGVTYDLMSVVLT